MINLFTKFGEFVIDSWKLWLFVFVSFWLIYDHIIAPKTVILDEKQFVCIESQPFGLMTRCVTYTRNIK